MGKDIYRASDTPVISAETIAVEGNSYPLEDISSVQVALFGMHLPHAGLRGPDRFEWLAWVAGIGMLLLFLFSCIGLASTVVYVAEGRCCSPPDPTANVVRFVIGGLFALVLVSVALKSVFLSIEWWLTIPPSIAAAVSVVGFVLSIVGKAPPIQIWPSLSDPLTSIIWACLIFAFGIHKAIRSGYGTSITLHGEFGALAAHKSWNPLAVHNVFLDINGAMSELNSTSGLKQQAGQTN